MNVGFIIPEFPGEKRVALLPSDIDNFPDQLWMEKGFGKNMNIDDSDYAKANCILGSKTDIFKNCQTIFSLKLIQPNDYDNIRSGQMIIGWTHPSGSGIEFMRSQADTKSLFIVDLDNIYPKLYHKEKSTLIPFIPKNFIFKNSFSAGCAAIMHAFLQYGALPRPEMNIAVLGNGNTAQGVFHLLSRFTDNIRMFYRKTMPEFLEQIADFDVIVNGIEMDNDGHIIDSEALARTKKFCLIIDAAADAGHAIEGTHYTTISNPMYMENNRFFYVVNNTPSLIYRDASRYLSNSFAKHIFKGGISRFWDIAADLK